ncbi:MAG: glycosyltransferase family 4 protein [Methylococcaceae bacterium]|nr:glycosyltransferase family 4 protein [Methylococcaceae bacterium]
MKRIKVFLLQEIIPSYRVPVFNRLARLENVELTVFYSRSSKAMLQENLKSAKVIEGFQHSEIGLWELGANSYQFGMLWRVLIGRPDVVISGNADCLDRLALLVLCKLLGIRVLWFQGGVPFTDEKKISDYANRGRLNRWLGKYNPKRWLMLKADGLIAYSEHAKNYSKMLGFPDNKLWVAPNSMDTEALESYRQDWLLRDDELQSERRRFSPQGQKILFLLGRLNKERKVDVLLQALVQLQAKGYALSLVIVGDGGERQCLEAMVGQLGLQNVYFEGAIYDEKDLSKYFMTSDIFVAPGACSLAIKMAMFFGRPVITADFGLEVHDVREGVNGFVFPLDDLQYLVDKLELLVQSDTLIKHLGAGGIATIRDRININTMVEGFRRAIFAEPEAPSH